MAMRACHPHVCMSGINVSKTAELKLPMMRELDVHDLSDVEHGAHRGTHAGGRQTTDNQVHCYAAWYKLWNCTVNHRRDLGMRRVCARWVPRLLSDEQIATRVNMSNDFLRRYSKDGSHFLKKIVTTDETWINLYEPETKIQSSAWRRPSSPPPKKAKTQASAGKVMFIMFFDSEGMILSHAVPRGQTVNGAYYAQVIIIYIFSENNSIGKSRPLVQQLNGIR